MPSAAPQPRPAPKQPPAPAPAATLPIAQIEISPLNVRTYAIDIERDAALEASILTDGLHYPVDVHPMRGRSRVWGAITGGRRTRAIKALVARGALPADYAVKVNLHEDKPDAELIELSLAENLLRRDLREHEIFAGVARAIAKGHDVAQVARGLGHDDERQVARWARLGQLAPPIFQALADGEIELPIAQAFAATADRELQEAVWERLRGTYLQARTVRRELKVGDAVQLRHLAFVGEAIYRAEGGRYELDLFADDAGERGRVVDVGLLEKLFDARMASVRDEVRAATERRELRFVAEPPQAHGIADYHLQVTPKVAAGKVTLPDGDIVAHVDVDNAGEPTVSYWWADRKAKAAGAGPERGPGRTVAAGPRAAPIGDATNAGYGYEARQAANAALKEEAGLTADATQIFRSIRTKVEAAALLADAEAGGDVARDYIVWAQARMLLNGNETPKTGMGRISTEGTIGFGIETGEAIRAHLAPLAASRALARGIERLKGEDFMTERDPAASWRLFRISAETTKRVAAALVAGLALDRSLAADGYRVALVPDAVMDECHTAADVDVRRYWHPTAELLDLLPKAQRLAIAEDTGTPEAVRRPWERLKSADLTAAVHRAIPADWVHPLLRFDAHAGIAADEPAVANDDAHLEQTEAAE